MVIPERETPGISAIACEKPISRLDPRLTCSIPRRFEPLRSAQYRARPIMISMVAISAGSRKLYSTHLSSRMPKIPPGMTAITRYQNRRLSTVGTPLRPSIAAAIRRTQSRQKKMITANSVPICMATLNVSPGSGQPKNQGTRIRWAVLEIGKKSVSPCTNPKIAA